MKKKGLFFGIFLLFCFVALGIWWSKNQTKSPDLVVPSPALNVNPSLTPVQNITTVPKYDGSSLLQTVPASLPTYTVSQPPSALNEATRIAALLGFAGTPETDQRTRGMFYVWTKNDSSLSVGGNPLEISYLQSTPEVKTKIGNSEGVFVPLARDFVDKLHIVPQGGTLSSPQIEFSFGSVSGIGAQPTSPHQANSVVLKYQLLLNSVPLVSDSPNHSSYTITLDGNKKVVSFFGREYPAIEQNQNVVPLLSLVEAVSMLNNGKGAIIAADAVEATVDYPEYKSYSLPQVKLDSVTLAYYIIQEQNMVVPVYVFGGTAADNNSYETVKTTTVLRAIR